MGQGREQAAPFLIQDPFRCWEPKSSGFGAMLGVPQGWWLRPGSLKQLPSSGLWRSQPLAGKLTHCVELSPACVGDPYIPCPTGAGEPRDSVEMGQVPSPH